MISEATLQTLLNGDTSISKLEKIQYWQSVEWLPEEDKNQIIEYLQNNLSS